MLSKVHWYIIDCQKEFEICSSGHFNVTLKETDASFVAVGTDFVVLSCFFCSLCVLQFKKSMKLFTIRFKKNSSCGICQE